MSHIGFIGVGDLAVYTVRGLRAGGYLEPILLSPRNHEKSTLLQQEYGCEILPDNQSVVDRSDCIFLATRPGDCLDALDRLDWPDGRLLISVVAGVDIDSLRGHLPDDVEIVRAMPVSSAAAGASPTLVYPAHEKVLELFDYCGVAIAADREEYFNQGSILACVYCWFFALFEELIESTRGPSLPGELAAVLVMGMARGAAELALANPDRSPGEIAAGIATEGTFSKQGLDLLRQREAFLPWKEACELLESQLAADS